MSNYTRTSNFFTIKDGLNVNDPAKVIKGAEFDTEYNNIVTAVASKADTADPTFTGTVGLPNVTVTGTITGGIIDGGTY